MTAVFYSIKLCCSVVICLEAVHNRKRLSSRRGTARRPMSAEILSYLLHTCTRSCTRESLQQVARLSGTTSILAAPSVAGGRLARLQRRRETVEIVGGQFCCVGGRAVRRSSGTNRHIQCSAVGDDVTWKLLPQLAKHACRRRRTPSRCGAMKSPSSKSPRGGGGRFVTK